MCILVKKEFHCTGRQIGNVIDRRNDFNPCRTASRMVKAFFPILYHRLKVEEVLVVLLRYVVK